MTSIRNERKHLAIFQFITSEIIPEVIITIPEARYRVFYTEQRGTVYLYNVQRSGVKKVLVLHYLPDNVILLHLIDETLLKMSYNKFKEMLLNDSDSVTKKSDWDRTFQNETELELKFFLEFKELMKVLDAEWKKVARITAI